MELTIDQALLQGVAAHKEGKLQEAERLYRAILQANAKHPDANHNLGVLAVGLNQVEGSLPHFKAAIEANPNEEQYWLSFTDALVKLGRMDDARKILEQGKANGLKGERVNALEASLVTSDKKSSLKEGLEVLLSLYNQGKLDDALAHGNVLEKQFPDNPAVPHLLLSLIHI